MQRPSIPCVASWVELATRPCETCSTPRRRPNAVATRVAPCGPCGPRARPTTRSGNEGEHSNARGFLARSRPCLIILRSGNDGSSHRIASRRIASRRISSDRDPTARAIHGLDQNRRRRRYAPPLLAVGQALAHPRRQLLGAKRLADKACLGARWDRTLGVARHE